MIRKMRQKVFRRYPALQCVVHDLRRYGRSFISLAQHRADVVFVPILGMHRSGTSCVSSILAANGLFLGDDLIEANEANPKGFFESDEAIRINDLLLNRFGRGYLDPPEFTPYFARPRFQRAKKFLLNLSRDHKFVGWKDPRTTVTWPAWHELLRKNRYQIVACFRHPKRVAASLLKIYSDLDEASAIGVWLNYNRRLIGYTDPIIWVNFDAPLADQIPGVCSAIGMPFDPHTLERFDDQLVRNQSTMESTGNDEADATYQWLLNVWQKQQQGSVG